MSETTHSRTYRRRSAAGTTRDAQLDSSGIDRRRAVSFLLLLICLAALGVSVAGVLRVRTVEVVGTNVPVNEIAMAAGVSGQNIFSVRTDAVVTRLEQVPSIQVSRVETAFPDRVIVYAQAKQQQVTFIDLRYKEPYYRIVGGLPTPTPTPTTVS